jgi:hypothetical protein
VKKCVHTVAIGNWRPDICEITLPNLKAYADRIGADFNVIREAKFPTFPPNYERFQILELGRGYDWNFNIDADTIMHPEAEDPTERIHPREFSSLWGISAKHYFAPHWLFEKDGRDQGISDNFTVSSSLIHEMMFERLNMTYDEMVKYCIRDPRQVSEFNFSMNLAKYGIPLNGSLMDHSKHYSIMCTAHNIGDKAVGMFLNKLREWGQPLP